jgi:hypothetical protein
MLIFLFSSDFHDTDPGFDGLTWFDGLTRFDELT